MLDITFGPGFWLFASYSYIMLVLGTFLLTRAIVHLPPLYQGQTATLLFGTLVPWTGNLLYITRLTPIPFLDLTPFAFTLSGLAIVWGVIRYHLLDIVPVARDSIIERMADAMIVLDRHRRIADLNPAA